MIINNRNIGPGYKPYFVAELSGNHNGDINRALTLIEKAKECGADAVKIQTYTPDTITIDHNGPEFTIKSGLWAGQTLYELYERAHTPWEWHEALFNKASEVGIDIFSSPFDRSAVDFLESLNAPAYKIASLEIVDHGLIAAAAETKKPLIISTGLASVNEIQEAIEVAKKSGATEICILHCTSGYPTPFSETNLNNIPDLISKFNTIAGLSDHTTGIAASIAAITLGASMIEKHFTLDQKDGGVDSSFSINPDELKIICTTINQTYEALGEVNYDIMPSEKESLNFRRSLYVVKDIIKGEEFTEENTRSIRPGYGAHPKHLIEVIGCKAKVNLKKGTPFELKFIE
jgi:pseudaminic acid synthase